ncbi:MAG: TIGR03986 family CRISPR-associated RAMP protein [Lachnospiraceae bacterium]|jgi:CRISPR-associated protein (TIGR03986 family)|nr:TIGR03986 family CRISPR-associated RAMP protein [Lachnospiraceae bacterium]
MSDFVNAYNFISLRDDKGKKQEYEAYRSKDGLLTGKIKCHLVTKTPLIIPDHEGVPNRKDNPDKIPEYPFMTVDGQPMIPGSSLRGVFRSAYETITDSCVFTNDDYYFSSRTGVAKKAGLLKEVNGQWFLYEAKRYVDSQDVLSGDFNVGDKVKFTQGEKTSKNRRGDIIKTPIAEKIENHTGSDEPDGYVMKIGRIHTAAVSHYGVFKLISNNGHRVPDICIKTFKENIKQYAENIKPKAEEAEKERFYVIAREQVKKYRDLLKNPNGEFIPVWYEEYTNNNGKKYYFALAQMSRNIYTNKPDDLLAESLKHCNDRKKLCPACALFGFIGKDNDSVGSRVRFSDAWCVDHNVLDDEKVHLLLGAPRSSSLEFYLRGAGDFYHADFNGVSLSGRKFYWHHSDFDIKKIRENEPTPEQRTMSSYLQYVKEKARFDFEVYFDGITKSQLDELYTALTYGDNEEDGKLCHKIGHGKPLGFGSVKVIADEVCVRTVSLNGDGVSYTEDKEFLQRVEAESLPPDLKKAVDFCAMKGQNIDYPRYGGHGEIYEWFSKNRRLSNRLERAQYHSILPKVQKDNQGQPFRPDMTGNSNNASGGGSNRKPGNGVHSHPSRKPHSNAGNNPNRNNKPQNNSSGSYSSGEFKYNPFADALKPKQDGHKDKPPKK